MDGVTEFRLSDYWKRRVANFLGANFPIEVALLDLNKVQLLGWENPSALLTDSYVRALERGHRFPLVDVIRRGAYYEIRGGYDGGHHRAVAHYIVGVPLRVRVFEKDREGTDDVELQSIRDLNFSDATPDEEEMLYEAVREDDPNII